MCAALSEHFCALAHSKRGFIDKFIDSIKIKFAADASECMWVTLCSAEHEHSTHSARFLLTAKSFVTKIKSNFL